MEAEVTTRADETGEIPHHAALEQGAADDRLAQSDQHPSCDEAPHNTTPVPEQENLYRMTNRHENPHWEEKMDRTHWEGKQYNVCKNTSQESVQDENHGREVHVHVYKYKQTTHIGRCPGS
jgi:hypothetical protein